MFTILLYGAGAAVVLFAASKVFPRSPIGRIGEAGMAQLDKTGLAIWRKDPVAILQRRIDQESRKIATTKDAIQRFKGYLNQNKRDFEKRTAELNQANARIDYWVQQGQDDKAEAAAAEVERLEKSFGPFKQQYDSMLKQYETALGSLKASNDFIVEARQRADQLGATLDMGRVNAQMREMTASLGIGSDGDVRSSIDQAFREVEREVDTTNAAVEVDDDLHAITGSPTANEKAEYEKAIAHSGASARVQAAKARLGKDGGAHQAQLPGS